MPISLDKLERQAPELVNLAKQADIVLAKTNLTAHTAKVALTLDISGSMESHYYSGRVQALAERALAIGTRFDDDGEIDVFLFGANVHYAGGMNLSNFKSFVANMLRKYPLEGGTNYGKAFQMVRQHFFKSGLGGLFAGKPTVPVYNMFVTDGATQDQAYAERELIECSKHPLFFEFMAIGGARSQFSFLEKLDDLKGRKVDNADFFHIPDVNRISDEELFSLLLTEYPDYIPQAKAAGILA